MKTVMKHMMWLGAAIGFIGIGSGAMAQGRPLTTGMACDQARSLVAAQGAAVLSTSPTTYDRYVASGAYCASGETPGPGWVPTKDASRCLVGSRCVSISRGSGP
jgi:hypothetical protein